MSPMTKRCSFCQHDVPILAKVCAHCHSKFSIKETEASFFDKCSAGFFWGVIAVIGWYGIVIVFGLSFWNSRFALGAFCVGFGIAYDAKKKAEIMVNTRD